MESPMQTPADRIAKRLTAEELRARFGVTIAPRGAKVYARSSATPPADRVAVRA
jgi:hypothetical protein